MNIVITILIGALVGWIASLIVKSPGGFLVDLLVGIIGAVIAGWLVGKGALSGGFDFMSIVWSLLGAVVLLLIVKLIGRAARRA
ncbi:MAG: GlsB/YeaQ/YmgE family stress response membrane protein [Chloroflexi bacterium]|nr:GlsB/YeaQ/YmgE family stress response membrane protein [Chloroflexota bacterium]